MKKILYIAIIITIAITTMDLIKLINESYYLIPENIVETDKFRNMNINAKSISDIIKLSEENNVNKSKLLGVYFLSEGMELNNTIFLLKKYKQIEHNYIKFSEEEYSKVCRAMEAVFNDIEYFPVAKSNTSDFWVSYENSYGADRNYNGHYKHEGTDIMAENNISGYYPIISATNGVVENLGWLEKGGYRVGIRADSGGYFYYAHLSSYSGINKGDKIKAGTLLGYMGDTGYGLQEGTSGNFDVHLHFGIYIKTENYDELSINPYYILKYLENKLIIANY